MRKFVDIVMAVLMIGVMSYQAAENLFHEALGTVLFLLFIIHDILNRKWYGSIGKRGRNSYQKMILAVNLMTLICILAATGTGSICLRPFLLRCWG